MWAGVASAEADGETPEKGEGGSASDESEVDKNTKTFAIGAGAVVLVLLVASACRFWIVKLTERKPRRGPHAHSLPPEDEIEYCDADDMGPI